MSVVDKHLQTLRLEDTRRILLEKGHGDFFSSTINF
jgi:hypothetical protein